MKCKVAREQDKLISPADMTDGDIGVVAKSESFDSPHVGVVVQKYFGALIRFGYQSDRCWDDEGKITKSCIHLLTPPFSLDFTED